MNWIKFDENDKSTWPIDDEDVLVYIDEDFHMSTGSFETDSGWDTEIPWVQKGSVTHWMPLPEPPKE